MTNLSLNILIKYTLKKKRVTSDNLSKKKIRSRGYYGGLKNVDTKSKISSLRLTRIKILSDTNFILMEIILLHMFSYLHEGLSLCPNINFPNLIKEWTANTK